MNIIYEVVGELLGSVLILLLLSWVFGYFIGMPLQDATLGQKIVRWEMRQIKRVALWSGGKLFSLIGDLSHSIAKKCGHGKKKP